MSESKTHEQNRTRLIVAISCAIFTLLMLLSMWFFLENPHHRIGDVAWNALFQTLIVPFAFLFAVLLFITAAVGQLPRWSGMISSFVMGAAAWYCMANVFPILLSI